MIKIIVIFFWFVLNEKLELGRFLDLGVKTITGAKTIGTSGSEPFQILDPNPPGNFHVHTLITKQCPE